MARLSLIDRLTACNFYGKEITGRIIVDSGDIGRFKYVIQDQRTWTVDKGNEERRCENWRPLEPEQDITEDHWYML